MPLLGSHRVDRALARVIGLTAVLPMANFRSPWWACHGEGKFACIPW
jgi:hypothetical protein